MTEQAPEDETEWSESAYPLLGTVVRVSVHTADPQPSGRLRAACRAAVDAIEAGQSTFSVFDEHSVLRRWQRDQDTPADAPPEFNRVLEAAARWYDRSDGRFHPGIAPLISRWTTAVEHQEQPDADTVDRWRAEVIDPPIVHRDGRWVPGAAHGEVNLNAIAKGHIVDAAMVRLLTTLGATPAVAVVNAGGDLLVNGTDYVDVPVEHPDRTSDNARPAAVLRVRNRAVASSGQHRRGAELAGRWIGHIIDPRTGWPASGCRSITVVAPDALTADVLCTAAGVDPPSAASMFIERIHAEDPATGIGALIIDDDGGLIRCGAIERYLPPESLPTPG